MGLWIRHVDFESTRLLKRWLNQHPATGDTSHGSNCNSQGLVAVLSPDIQTWLVVSICFHFYPDPWGNDPIWRSYFSDGLVQPPTRNCTYKLQFEPSSDKSFPEHSLKFGVHPGSWIHFVGPWDHGGSLFEHLYIYIYWYLYTYIYTHGNPGSERTVNRNLSKKLQAFGD